MNTRKYIIDKTSDPNYFILLWADTLTEFYKVNKRVNTINNIINLYGKDSLLEII